MSLTAAEVAEIMRLVEQSTFDELTLEMNGVKLVLKRGAAVQLNGAGEHAATGWASGADGASGGGAMASGAPSTARAGTLTGTPQGAAATHATATRTAAPPATYSVGTNAPVSSAATAPRDANSHDVPSPLLGTFYRAPKPGAPPFIEVGARVEDDTVIGIIEVMKLMNTVRAGTRGTVTDIFIADGALAEFDQPLIRVRKSG